MSKAIIFDIFGVLYPDTFWSLANKYLPERNEKMQQLLHEIIRKSDSGFISQEQFWEEAADAFGISYEAVILEKNSMGGVDEALIDYIKTVKERGFKVGIISNVGHGFIERALDQTQKKVFDSIVLSGPDGHMKPARGAYELSAEQLGVPIENCLFFDDIDRNVAGAIDAGMKSELYENFVLCKQQTESFLTADTDK